MSKVNEMLNTKTEVFEKSVKGCYNVCLTILSNMAKTINYNADGIKTICTFDEQYNGFKFSFAQYQQAQKKLRIKKAFNKRFANYKTIYQQYTKVKNVTIKTNGFFFIVTRETKNGFEKFKYDNLKIAKQKFAELAK